MSGMRDWTNVKDVSILATNSSTADRLFDFVLPQRQSNESNRNTNINRRDDKTKAKTKNFMSEFPVSE